MNYLKWDWELLISESDLSPLEANVVDYELEFELPELAWAWESSNSLSDLSEF